MDRYESFDYLKPSLPPNIVDMVDWHESEHSVDREGSDEGPVIGSRHPAPKQGEGLESHGPIHGAYPRSKPTQLETTVSSRPMKGRMASSLPLASTMMSM